MSTELWGGTVERSSDGVSFTAVAGVLGVKVPSISFEKKRTTTLDNASKVHTYKKGFGDPGDFMITCQMTDAGYAAALIDQAAATTYYRVTIPGGTVITVECLAAVSGIDAGELDDVLEFELGGPCTGDITVA